jgi:hypothetical protein
MSNDEKLRNGILNHGKETAQIETSQDWSPNGSSASTPTEAPLRTVIFFEPGDPENPCNWPWVRLSNIYQSEILKETEEEDPSSHLRPQHRVQRFYQLCSTKRRCRLHCGLLPHPQ